MSRQVINVGSNPNDETGDGLRVAYQKCNDNFTELFDQGRAFKNWLINPSFSIWQRGTSFTATGYTADRFRMALGSGAAVTVSRQTHTVGQTDVAANPTYFLRFDRTTTGSALSTIEQRIEDVRVFSGKKCVLSFWAKASSAITVSGTLKQHFGTGGSPSSDVDTGLGNFSLTTSWQRFSIVVNTVPSISGKTLGTAENNYTSIIWEMPTAAGVASFDLSNVQFEEGGVATDFERRANGVELMLAQRFYEKSYDVDTAPGTATSVGVTEVQVGAGSTNAIYLTTKFATWKRGTPTITSYDSAGNSGKVYRAGENKVAAQRDISQSAFTNGTDDTTNTARMYYQWTADAEL